jgi:hypothetical protein
LDYYSLYSLGCHFRPSYTARDVGTALDQALKLSVSAASSRGTHSL